MLLTLLNQQQPHCSYPVSYTHLEYKRLAALTEGSDEYNAEVESMYTKITAEDTAKSYADKYNTCLLYTSSNYTDPV